ncbi:MAG: class I SAM-dependent methyltransferase [Lautropia sp.]|nr:class I SAM-dependent methyltransferase [Lautropia sp.]
MSYSYQKDAVYNLFFRPGAEAFGYSEGEEAEGRLLKLIEALEDRSTFSEGLVNSIDDWSTRYHFSRSRHCLLRPLGIKAGDSVLELGCGTGAITRYLGETGATITAVEGSLARARVAAARCQDLPNVRVIADDLQAVDADGQYDWVTLIGVLEYAAAYSSAPDAYQAYLSSAIRHLKPGGHVVIAIENQLGLKYFNGCSEDHLGTQFSGIQDFYQLRGGVRTFGKQALSSVLNEAGLVSQTWLYPFPDYKVPNVVLSDAALAHPGFNAADLLLRNISEDYSGNMLRLFDEALAMRALAQNGLLSDLSNSFLVVASPARDKPWQASSIAWAFSVHRRPAWCTETRFEEEGDTRISVRKRLIHPSDNHACKFLDGQEVGLVEVDAEYFQGWQVAWSVLKAHAQRADTAQIVEAFMPWARHLLAMAIPEVSPLSVLPDGSGSVMQVPMAMSVSADEMTGGGSSDFLEEKGRHGALRQYSVPGQYIDHAPFNLLVNDIGEEYLIDQEWVVSCPVPVGWVLTRGVLHALQMGTVPRNQLGSLARVVIALADACGYDATQDDVRQWFELESVFSFTLAPRKSSHKLSDATQLPYALVGEALNEARAESVMAHQALKQLEERLRATETSLALRDEENIRNLTRIDQYQLRIQDLEHELVSMRNSRSWRWSGWLRTLRRRSRI